VSLRGRICYLLARLKIYSPDCENCNAHEMCGSELQKRLEELNWRTLPRPLKSESVVEGVEATTAKADQEEKLSA
jgi:hypothetical protein